MIELPNFEKVFAYENAFYLSCAPERLRKVFAHYELFRMIDSVEGAIVECGVFKGVSFCRWAALRYLFGQTQQRALVGLDTFGEFPETAFEADKPIRAKFIKAAGSQSISVDQLWRVLRQKRCEKNVTLIEGDICQTAANYRGQIALLHMDVDMHEPACAVLDHLWPQVVPGGLLVLDDMGAFPGTTAAVEDRGLEGAVEEFTFSDLPKYIRKGQ